MGRCSVKLRHHPCYNTDGDGNLINHWQVSEGQSHASGVGANDAANAVVISGCNKHAVTVYEHGHGEQNNHNQHVYTFKDGYWETWNQKHCGGSHHMVDHDWLLGDEISSVKIEALPQDNLKVNGQVTYEIEIPDNNHGYNTRLHGGDYTAWKYRPDGGGRHKDMPIGNGFTGYPCTKEAKSAIWTQSSAGTHGNPKRGQKMHCTFDINEAKLKSLNEATKSNRDPRRGMYNSITQRICDGIWESNPDFKYGDGDKTCWDKKKSQGSMEKFCGGSHIKNPSRKKHCNPKVLGQALYEQLGGAYCKSKPTDEWCACYNVMTHKDQCTKKANLPGCEDVTEQIEMMEEDLSADALATVKGTEVCWGSCTGSDTDTFIPKEYDKGGVCNRDVAICVSNITAGNLRDSGIKVEQNCGNKGAPDSESSGSGSGKDGLKRSDIEAGVITDTKTAESIMNRERFYEKSSFKWGGGAAVSSSSCLICIITIVVLFL
jgi:hypothetical protein